MRWGSCERMDGGMCGGVAVEGWRYVRWGSCERMDGGMCGGVAVKGWMEVCAVG